MIARMSEVSSRIAVRTSDSELGGVMKTLGALNVQVGEASQQADGCTQATRAEQNENVAHSARIGAIMERISQEVDIVGNILPWHAGRQFAINSLTPEGVLGW